MGNEKGRRKFALSIILQIAFSKICEIDENLIFSEVWYFNKLCKCIETDHLVGRRLQTSSQNFEKNHVKNVKFVRSVSSKTEQQVMFCHLNFFFICWSSDFSQFSIKSYRFF